MQKSTNVNERRNLNKKADEKEGNKKKNVYEKSIKNIFVKISARKKYFQNFESQKKKRAITQFTA